MRNEIEEDVRIKVLLETLMQSALTLARYSEAVNLADRQLQRAERFAQGDQGTALAVLIRAAALATQGRFALAIADWEAVLQQRSVWFGYGSPQHINALAALVMLHRLAQQDERASKLETQHIALMRRLPSPVPPIQAPQAISYAASFDLAQILLDAGAQTNLDSNSAEQTLAQARQLELRAEAFIAQHREHLALPDLGRALGIRRKLQGDEHAQTKRLLTRIEWLAKRAESAR